MTRYEEVNGILRPLRGEFKIGGRFSAKLIRADETVEEWDVHNLIVNQGLDHILATEFAAGAQITSWFMGVFGNNYVPVGTDTAASIAANSGEIAAYNGSGRQPYTGVEGGQQVTNAAAPANFTFTAPETIYGAFVISSSGFQATTGVLFAAAQFTASKLVGIGDQLLLTYAFGAASS